MAMIRRRVSGRLKVLALAITLVCFFSIPFSFAQAKDLLLGTWLLDLGKSSFVPDDPPQKRVITVTANGSGIRCVIRTTVNGGLDNGMIAESEFTAKYDGNDNDISESILDTVSLKKVDANTIQRTGKIRGNAVETATMKLSPDGKTLTVTTKGSVNGRAYNSVQVYEKQ